MIKPLQILYLAAGGPSSSSMAKARALHRLGHEVTVVNLHECHPRNIWMRRLDNVTGYRLRQRQVTDFIASRIGASRFDVVWVDSGNMVGPKVLKLLRHHGDRLINYNHDDPTGVRDGNVWESFKRAVPGYDLMVTVRKETEQELKALGARRVLRVWRSYDEIEHRPRELSTDDHARWDSQVVFAGTWMPERGALMADLIRRGLPLAIYGDFWHKAPEWPIIQANWRGPAIYGDDYAKAIQCSKIAIGLLSKGNRDLHTQRSAEIPAMGGLLCAERTEEHLRLYEEPKEAVFWSSADECLSNCKALLENSRERDEIKARGLNKVRDMKLGHESVMASILQQSRPM